MKRRIEEFVREFGKLPESDEALLTRRVKGSEKLRDGDEALLQLSADCLLETGPLAPFWRQRKLTTGQRRHQAAA